MAENAFKADWPSFALGFNTGKSKGGGAELNIAYGDTPPEDTSKLWVKTDEPSKLLVAYDFNSQGAEKEITTLSQTMLTKAKGVTCVPVDRKIYLFGGNDGLGSLITSISCFDTDTQEVSSTGVSFYSGQAFVGGCLIGTDIYLIPKSSQYLYRFDTVNKTVGTTGVKLTANTSDSGRWGTNVGTKIYILSGNSYSTKILCYDTEAETVTTLAAKLSIGTSYAGCAAVGTKIYGFGGRTSSRRERIIQCFDTEAETVTILGATLPHDDSYQGCAVVDNNIYIFGGYDGSVRYDSICCFDAETETLEMLSAKLPQVLCEIGCATVDDTIYLFGGDYNGSTANHRKEIMTFQGSTQIENGTLAIKQARNGNIFPIINTETARIETGVASVLKGNADNIGERVEAALYKDGTWTTI